MTSLSAAIIGYGAVASIHARSIAAMPEARVAIVFGPDAGKARSFAERHGIEASTADLGTAVSSADVALICSPTHCHFQEAKFCLQAGVPVLVELPACSDVTEAITLGKIADSAGVLIQCAQTSRYIEPYKMIRDRLDRIGPVQQVNYLRDHIARLRSWLDDPVLHHAAHPIDIMIDWFDGVTAVGQVSYPDTEAAESVSLLGRLPNGAPASISICYRSRLLLHRLTLVGTDHAIEVSGFGRLQSDLPDLGFHGDDEKVYESAIAEQDRQFLAACKGRTAGVKWSDTIRLMRTIGEFQHFRPFAVS